MGLLPPGAGVRQHSEREKRECRSNQEETGNAIEVVGHVEVSMWSFSSDYHKGVALATAAARTLRRKSLPSRLSPGVASNEAADAVVSSLLWDNKSPVEP